MKVKTTRGKLDRSVFFFVFYCNVTARNPKAFKICTAIGLYVIYTTQLIQFKKFKRLSNLLWKSRLRAAPTAK